MTGSASRQLRQQSVNDLSAQPRNPEGTATTIKTSITALLIGTAVLFGAEGVAHADSDVPHACQALLHQPKTALDGPNQAVQELERVYGLDPNHAEALVDQLIVLNKDDPAGWRPSQTCFDLWHEGYIK
ncbi:hypothetical protein [Mycobacterium sp. 1245852.3]|uniref:hypothetical protein n=1 Tax=Mycobacterium sp. 1245852.3 TaxID=1856860 RepID=UPI0012EA161E|nr:hypothetical protein [Mycobacterium sp. 1245852.3]